ncbi:uncharacterized protein LOC143245579 [Tachypleus tridentatus]|uniref:uncharacterized protein LOC143245579 n=1 Tax=Tachypleus tridentatus TaxID=6853 RepID=UPI003FD68F7D
MNIGASVLILIFLFPVSVLSQVSSCFGGIETYEKTTNTAFAPTIQSNVLLQQQDVALTRDCISSCQQTAECLAFGLDYASFRCFSYGVNSVGRRDQLVSMTSTNFFEKICIRGVEKQTYDNLCGSLLWAFERVKEAYLDDYVEKELTNVQTKEECERSCLMETEFVCRSADYDNVQQICRLSKEERRTQPQAFRQIPGSSRDYLENHCAASAPSTCRYDIKQNRSIISMDSLQFARSSNDCQMQCDRETNFVCRAYTFDDPRCYLSGDDSVSLDNPNYPPRPGAVYGEKKCVIEQCTGGIFSYEKITGYVLRSALSIPIPVASPVSTLKCRNYCQRLGLDCPAFSVNYINMRCDQLDRNSQGRTQDLMQKDGENYFERICLRGQKIGTCENKAWAFERVLGYMLSPGLYEKIIQFVQSRRDCEEMCLNEQSFHCRSALYDSDSTECKLSKDSRRTKPNNYQPTNNRRINYLENECINVISCPYQETTSAYPTYTDVIEMNVRSQQDCEQMCDDYINFNCRSFAFYSSNEQCFISGDDKISGGAAAIRSRTGLNYYEKNCEGSLTTESTTIMSSSSSSSTTPTSAKCFSNERQVFEKITGYDMVGVSGTTLYQSTIKGVTSECSRLCRLSNKCKAFVIDYQQQRCTSLKTTSTDQPSSIQPSYGRSYFEVICISRSLGCAKLWLFERFSNQELQGAQPSDTVRVFSGREDCERRCLEERRFLCVSVNYYISRRECNLYREGRNSPSVQLVPSSDVEYLENQCNVNETSSCSYNSAERDISMLYITKSLTGVTSTFQCEQLCDRERDFNCRSYTLDRTRCLLSSESRETGQFRALQPQSGAIYVEKTCRDSGKTTFPSTPTKYSTFPTRYPTFPTRYPTFPTVHPRTPSPFPPTYPTLLPPVVCGINDYTYEKTIGYDFMFGRRDVIRTQGVIGVLAECQRGCQQLGDMCQAFVIIYGRTQKCYCLGMGGGNNPESLSPSPQSSYFEKVCLKGRSCGKLWTFERIIGYEFQGKVEREISGVFNRHDCQDYCLSESTFLCRAANYYYQHRICRLFSENRRSQPKLFHRIAGVAEYLENQCAPEHSTCQFQDFNDRFFSRIDRLTRARSLHECQQQCDLEKLFTCRSVDYEVMTRDCGLCSDDTTTLEHGKKALETRRFTIYSEKGTCEKVSVQCTPQDMLVTLNFESPFSGRVYARGNPSQCFVVGQGQTSIQLAISLGSRCGSRQEGEKLYVNEVVIQKHPIIVTESDRTVRVVCSFEMGEHTVTLGSPFQGGIKGVDVTTQRPSINSVVTNTASPPKVSLRILDRYGRDARLVGLGDELILKIEIQETSSAFAIFARNLYARSANGESLFLIDSNGCPTDPSIFPSLQLDQKDYRSLFSRFKAFRFPSTGLVNFEVQIRFCQDFCEHVLCANNELSYGRRKRDTVTKEAKPQVERPMLGSNFSSVNQTKTRSISPPSNSMKSSPVLVPVNAVIEDIFKTFLSSSGPVLPSSSKKIPVNDSLHFDNISNYDSLADLEKSHVIQESANASKDDKSEKFSNISYERISLTTFVNTSEPNFVTTTIPHAIIKSDKNTRKHSISTEIQLSSSTSYERSSNTFYGSSSENPNNKLYDSSSQSPNSHLYGSSSERPNNKLYGSSSERPNNNLYGSFSERLNNNLYGSSLERPNNILYGSSSERHNSNLYDNSHSNNPYNYKQNNNELNSTKRYWMPKAGELYFQVSVNEETTPEITATTERPIPQEIPLSLAIMVGEDAEKEIPVDKRDSKTLLDVKSKLPGGVCTSRSTFITVVTAVSLIYFVLIAAAIFCRFRIQKNRKKQFSDDELPFRVPAFVATTDGKPHQMIYGSSDDKFTSIYGTYDSPP